MRNFQLKIVHSMIGEHLIRFAGHVYVFHRSHNENATRKLYKYAPNHRSYSHRSLIGEHISHKYFYIYTHIDRCSCEYFSHLYFYSDNHNHIYTFCECSMLVRDIFNAFTHIHKHPSIRTKWPNYKSNHMCM